MPDTLPRQTDATADGLPPDPNDDRGSADRSLLFALMPPDAAQKRAVGVALGVLLVVFLALVPFAKVALRQHELFLPAYASARVVIETITAALLFSMFRTFRAPGVLVLGGGYLFSAFMTIGHVFAFVQIHSAGGALNEASQTTAWIYFVWHGAFSVVLLAYALTAFKPVDPDARRSVTHVHIGACVIASAVFALLSMVFAASDLPDLMAGDRDSANKMLVAGATALLNVVAIVAVARRRPRRLLDLWVLTVGCAWLFDTGLAALFNGARFDLGWYAGRVYGLLAAGFLLIMLLVEHSRVYRRMVKHHASLQRSSVEQLRVALSHLSVAQRAASAGFWDWDLQTGRWRWSEELFQLYGIDSRTERAGFDPWRKVVHPDDLTIMEGQLAEALERKVPLFNRYRIVRPDIGVRWLDTYGDVLRDADGRATRMTGLCIDVTDRVAAEEALRESEGKLRIFIEHAPSALAMLDEHMRYVAVSWRWLSDYGLSGTIIGRSHYEVFPEIPQRWKDVHRRALAGEVIRSEEDSFEREDGSVQWLRWEIRPWHRANGSIGGIVAMSEDITGRKGVQDALRDSEYFYRQTLESIPGMVFTTSADGAVDYQSQQWVDYTGVPMSEHLGEGWHHLLHPEDRQRALEAWQASVRVGSSYDLEYRVRRRDGAHEWFKVIGRPIRDAHGRVVRWFGVAVNIERLKQAEAQAARHRRELEAMLDAMPAMVYTKDALCRYTRANAALSAFVRLPAASIVGRKDAELLPPQLARAAADSDARVLASKASIKNEEDSWLDAAGRERWVSTSKSPFLHDDGSVAGLVGVSIEITEQKLAEARRVVAIERQRDALVREVHHRIKNHLQGVIGLLRYKGSRETGIDSRLELAIAQIGSIAQVYGLQGRSADAQLRLHELVESAIQSASTAVDFSCAEDLKDIVLSQADAVPLALVINELITNAIKHLDRNRSSGTVHVRLHGGTEGVAVEVRGGPARLPPDFDYAQRRGLGTGLELVSVLLPERRCRLTLDQIDDDVVARLVLLPDAWSSPAASDHNHAAAGPLDPESSAAA
jgi:PAS domain S-box-containing protein